MKKIKEIIVVEGRDDTRRVKESLNADTIETNGSAIDEATIEQIKKAQANRGVIVFTDPDFPGERIRKIISQAVPGVKHAFLNREEAKPTHKGSLGIEHASPEIIRQSLRKVYTEAEVTSIPSISRPFLVEMGLLNGPRAKERRQKLGEKLRIGYTNGKQLKKRLEMFSITEQTIKDTLKELEDAYE